MSLRYDSESIRNGTTLSDVRIFQTINSTNRYAKENTFSGDALILAYEQSAGYGRHKRPWKSTQGKDILFSLILHAQAIFKSPLTPLYAAYILVTSLEFFFPAHKKRITIKYPNDIYLDGKKLAGILIERAYRECGCAPDTIIGVGINIAVKNEFASSFDTPPAALDECDTKGFDANRFLNRFLTLFYKERTYLTDDKALFLERIRPYHYLYGKRIHALLGKRHINGIAKEINSDGTLTLECSDGNILQSAHAHSFRIARNGI